MNADGEEVIQAVFTDITEVRRIEIESERQRLIENQSLRAAICTAYPLIMRINLTQDYYECFVEEQDSYTIDRAEAMMNCSGTVPKEFIPLTAKTIPACFPEKR